MSQPGLFVSEAYPPGFAYRADFLSRDEERDLLRKVEALEFSGVEMRGVVARRRTAHFGWTYGYYARRTAPGPEIPEFLRSYRGRIAAWAAVDPQAFVEVLVTDYPEGAPIGWHRDAPAFGDVIAGISLGAAARMKFRPYVSPAAQSRMGERRLTTHEIDLAPRSAYLIAGVARRDYAPEGIAMLREWGFEEVLAYTHGLAWDAAHLLAERWNAPFATPRSMVGAMVTVALPERAGSTDEDASRLRLALLVEDRIEVQLHAWRGRLWARLSIQIYNDLDDVTKLAEAVLGQLNRKD